MLISHFLFSTSKVMKQTVSIIDHMSDKICNKKQIWYVMLEADLVLKGLSKTP